ncbi:MAG: hypothetical protein HY782_23530 [Chloroflexi bacterium]|nr:hypothetical protein [Chloroflexota bacterium]
MFKRLQSVALNAFAVALAIFVVSAGFVTAIGPNQNVNTFGARDIGLATGSFSYIRTPDENLNYWQGTEAATGIGFYDFPPFTFIEAGGRKYKDLTGTFYYPYGSYMARTGYPSETHFASEIALAPYGMYNYYTIWTGPSRWSALWCGSTICDWMLSNVNLDQIAGMRYAFAGAESDNQYIAFLGFTVYNQMSNNFGGLTYYCHDTVKQNVAGYLSPCEGNFQWYAYYHP